MEAGSRFVWGTVTEDWGEMSYRIVMDDGRVETDNASDR